MTKCFKKNMLEKYIKLYDQYVLKYGKIVLLYEIGSFYEIMGVENDKEVLGNVSEVCDDVGLTKTRANKKIKQNSRTNPLQGGFPSHSLNNYIPKFLKHNYTVIVYSQYSEGTKKVRNLEKIVSPSTYIENVEEDDSVNLVCLYVESTQDDTEISMMVLDMSTGKCVGYSVGGKHEESIKKIARLLHTSCPPKEVVIVGGNNSTVKELEIEETIVHHRKIDKTICRASYQKEFFSKVFPNHGSLSSIEYVGMEKYPSLTISFILLLNFAYEHDESVVQKISKPQIKELSQYLHLTHRTINQLNLTKADDPKYKSLFDIINKTSTPGGKRLLKQRLLTPVINIKTLKERYDDIENMDYKIYETYLKNIGDLERLHRRIFLKKLLPSEFSVLDSSYKSVLKILKCKNNMNEMTIKKFKKFIRFYREYLDLDIIDKYSQNNIEEPIFKQGLYSEIDEFYKEVTDAKEGLANLAIELSRCIEETNNLVKVEKTATEGYFLTTTKKRFNTFLAPYTKKYGFDIKVQTNNVKIFSKKIREFSHTILSSNEKMIELNRKKFIELLEHITKEYQVCLKNIANYISHIDVVKSCAKVAEMYNYCRPVVEKARKSFVEAVDLRHPIVERIYEDEDFVSNDLSLGKNTKGILLYGINGSGKSIWLKSIGISVIMAQAGFYVPGKCFTFSPYKNLITKISMVDDLYRQQSTFTCEMSDLRYMLEHGNENTLILADELCSGTETNSAIAIVAASIQSLSNKNANFLFTTHLHQLTKISNITELTNVNFYHLSVEVSDGEIIYGRKLQTGSGSDTYGVEIAKQLKVGDSEFIRNAISVRRMVSDVSDQILSTKQSRYNKDVYMDKCEKCGAHGGAHNGAHGGAPGGPSSKEKSSGLHTHHIKHQKDADGNNMIDGYHKNRKSNLQVLCETCHQEEHS